MLLYLSGDSSRSRSRPMSTGRRIPRAHRGLPPAGKTTEKNINTMLGVVLREKHPRWSDRIDVESTGVFKKNASWCPDILVRHPGGVPVVIETKFQRSSQSSNDRLERVEKDAIERLALTMNEGDHIVEQAISVRYPNELRSVGQHMLDSEIRNAILDFCVFSGTKKDYSRWPRAGWISGSVDDLANCIEHVALSEDRIARGMKILEDGVGSAAYLLQDDGERAPDMLRWVSEQLHQKSGKQTFRMAMAVLANALIFHTSIVGTHGIPAIQELKTPLGRVSKLEILDQWRYILENINYWPIFRIASDILIKIRDAVAHRILDCLAKVAISLADLGAVSQQDLCGRMFQRLITDRKFLATFYTLPSSAALLAELATARLDIDWADESAVTSLRIADFACGTGALLNAAYGAVTRRYRREGGDDEAIHPQMMENALVGADIMPAATHLTASVLSGAHPSVPFKHTSILTLPYGNQSVTASKVTALGSLDLIDKEDTVALFDLGHESVKGGKEGRYEVVKLQDQEFDLVIMNPPFTRPTNHKSRDVPVPSFAGFDTSDDEQKEMSKRLAEIRKPNSLAKAGHGNAGLASNFVDLADVKVKRGGVIALVLPAAFLQGKSWENARSVLERRYSDIVVVTIASKGTTERAFSADTGMGEVLVLATRKRPEENQGSALYINLDHRPGTLLEAVTVASVAASIPESQNSGNLWISSEESAGWYIRGPLSQGGGAGVMEQEVCLAASSLVEGSLRLAQMPDAIKIPLTSLGSLGNRGLVDRDINGKEGIASGNPRGPFDIVRSKSNKLSSYPILWSHAAELEKRLIVEPDRHGVPRKGSRDHANKVWETTSSRLHYNRDFGLSSQPLTACVTEAPSIGGRAWPNFVCTNSRWENPLVLWANTTLGCITFWWSGSRQHQGRALITITRLPELRVLDVRELSKGQLDQADKIFKEFATREFLPANEAWRDETRQELDHAVLVELLHLPEDIMQPLALLRRQWCAEPTVHGGKSTRPPA